MSEFSLDLADIASTPTGFSSEEFIEVKRKYLVAKAKVDSGAELTLEAQRDVIQYCRADRETKFEIAKSKPKSSGRAPASPKVRTAKKLARAKMLEVFMKKELGAELTVDETMDLKRSLAEYTGKKLTKSLIHTLLIDEQTRELNPIELRDKQKTLFGD